MPMDADKTNKTRFGRPMLIGLICLGLLLVILGGYLYLWHVPLPLTLTIAQPNGTPALPTWRLIFDEEFNKTHLDITRWDIEDSSASGYHNCCLNYGVQYFTPQALSFHEGSLRIKTQQQYMFDRLYTSGAITTENKFSFLYGRVDIRARVPKTKGFWPALWLLPNHSIGIAPFEIDIMEIIGDDPTTVHMSNHWGKLQRTQKFTGPDFSQEYHVFSIVWTHQAIGWYIDGVKRFESEQGVSDQKMYLIINSTIGGSWPGHPDATTVLPQYMDVDYVRIYQPAAGHTVSASH